MLVISQKEKGQILIGKDITIRVLELKPGRVKLGIEAPSDVKIKRVEAVSDAHKAHGLYAEKQHKKPHEAVKTAEDDDSPEK